MFGIVYHTGYLTDDLEQAIAFYQKTFGGEVLGRNPSATSKIAYVKIGESEVELIEPADKSRLGGRSGLIIDHVGYFVPDFDKAVADLAARGIRLASEPYVSAAGYRNVYLDPADTNGMVIHLSARV